MRRLRPRTRIALIAGAVALSGGIAALTVGPVLYRDLIVGKPAAAPVLRAGSASGSGLSDLPSSWKVVRGSYAGYRVDEQLNGTPVTVTGRTRAVTGEVHTSAGTADSGRIVVDLREVATDEAARDDYFRSTVIDTKRYPTATFTLARPIAAPAGTRTGSVVKVVADGTLELHGRTRQVSVPLQTVVGARSSQVAGSIPVRFSDYGVTAPSLGFVTVQRTGRIEFLLQLAPST